jgi:hypothetical protein
MAQDLARLAEAIASAARRGVEIELWWHKKLLADHEMKQQSEARKLPSDAEPR